MSLISKESVNNNEEWILLILYLIGELQLSASAAKKKMTKTDIVDKITKGKSETEW